MTDGQREEKPLKTLLEECEERWEADRAKHAAEWARMAPLREMLRRFGALMRWGYLPDLGRPSEDMVRFERDRAPDLVLRADGTLIGSAPLIANPERQYVIPNAGPDDAEAFDRFMAQLRPPRRKYRTRWERGDFWSTVNAYIWLFGFCIAALLLIAQCSAS